jgi:hypothetical protein
MTARHRAAWAAPGTRGRGASIARRSCLPRKARRSPSAARCSSQ